MEYRKGNGKELDQTTLYAYVKFSNHKMMEKRANV